MRKFQVNVNGKSYVVEVDELSGGQTVSAAVPAVGAPAPAAAAPASPARPAGGATLKSPLPGAVFKLMVPDGAVVKKGDKIINIEAMKMENEIESPADGRVSFLVRQGQTIETGTELAVIG